MQLVNMKMDPKEAEEESGLLAAQVDQAPAYPYGLTISLCDESLQKLGVSAPPAVGSTVMITARATVTNVSAEQLQSGETEQRLGLQITDMAMGSSSAPKSAAATLYGGDEG